MRFTFLLIIILTLSISACRNKSYPNLASEKLWVDINGNRINAHGGGILKFEGKYYWFGTYLVERSRKNESDEGVSCYSSVDLKNWKFEGLVLQTVDDKLSPLSRGCIIERPKVIHNKMTGKFVMWFHHELKGEGYSSALTALAVSDKITGPYEYKKSFRPNAKTWPLNYPDSLKTSFKNKISLLNVEGEKKKGLIVNGFFLRRDFEIGQMSRDMTLFVDTDEKAYHIHSSENNQTIHISELTDDYMDFTGKYIRVLAGEANEAPAIVKNNDKYYMISSGCTGWKPNPARSASSTKMMGDWKNIGNPIDGTQQQIATTFNAQSTHIIKMKDGYILMADKWTPSEIQKSEHLWLSLQFKNEKPIITQFD